MSAADLLQILQPEHAKRLSKFFELVTRTQTCWHFQNLAAHGYGKFTILGKQRYAHRIALVLATEQCPAGMYACHSCNTPSCVRPTHLYWGTQAQNMKDKRAAGTLTGPAWRGERQSKARLTDAEAVEIYLACLNTKEPSHRALAAQYQVPRHVIADIARRRGYRFATAHLPDIPLCKRHQTRQEKAACG